MANMTTVEVKAFVPAKDFDLSKRFYQDLSFALAWSDDHLAYFRHGSQAFCCRISTTRFMPATS